MANRKQFRTILQQKAGPAHLEGLATWIDQQDEDPPICPRCNTDEYVEWRSGEWMCNNCGNVISNVGW